MDGSGGKTRLPLTVRNGYARWSRSYDHEDNPLIRLEERVVSQLSMPVPGRVLDAACGTGRHALRLGLAGARVVGVDMTGEMLAVAAVRARQYGLKDSCFVRGRLGPGLPVAPASFDLAVCALALCHVVKLREAIASLCRTVRPGGQVLVTDLHPAAVEAGLETIFADGGEEYSIQTARHTKKQYLDALAVAGAELVVDTDAMLGEALAHEPRGLPAGVYAAGWEDLPFCLVLLARMPDED